MSHTMFRQKAFAVTSDNIIIPLARYADSSLTRGHGRHEYHPTWWMFLSIVPGVLFPQKDAWVAAAQKEYDEQIAKLTEYEKSDFGSGKPVGPDSYNYYGTTYPGGGKLKNMKSFMSVRRCMPFSELVRRFPNLGVTIEVHESCKPILSDICMLRSEEDVHHAEEVFRRFNAFAQEHPKSYVCVEPVGVF